MPFLPPNQQRKALKAHELLYHGGLNYILCKFVSYTASVRLVTALNEQMWIHKLYRYSKFDMNRPIEALHKPTSTHTHRRLTALCPGLPGWAGNRKVKPVWKRQWLAVAPAVFNGRMPFLSPNQQRQSTEGKSEQASHHYKPLTRQ